MSAYDKRPIRRGGPNGVWCLGNNEPDGNAYIANWNGASIGAKTREEAERKLRQLSDIEQDQSK